VRTPLVTAPLSDSRPTTSRSTPHPSPQAGGVASRPAAPGRSDAYARRLAAIVCAARAGDHWSWLSLVRRFDQDLRGIARSYRLAPSDVDDVVQTTWLHALQDIQKLREPTAIGAWLATATRRNAMRLLQRRTREYLTDDPEIGERQNAPGPEAELLAAERREILTRAMATLPQRHRQLMTILLGAPTLDYRQVGELLCMPIGSIGPTRARSLVRLSRHPQLRELRSASA
jgi:RNA polymerase sigma factor (sigma-70 family)